MFEVIRNSLDRQYRGLMLLDELLDEEFSMLMEHRSAEILTIELSIHELIRQLADEKLFVQKQLGGGKVLDFAAMLMDDAKEDIQTLWQAIDNYEQKCSRQASHNAELSLALLDQSKSLLSFLHKQVQPKSTNVYGKKGVYQQNKAQAALLSGRL